MEVSNGKNRGFNLNLYFTKNEALISIGCLSYYFTVPYGKNKA